MRKGYIERYGSDDDCINKLMECGRRFDVEGGKFMYKIGSDFRMNWMCVLFPRMRLFATRYGDYVQKDGTHGCNVYGWTAMFDTVVDSLGKAVLCITLLSCGWRARQ